MAAEEMWVSDEAQLDATVATLVAQGGTVEARVPGEATLFVAKKLSVPVLVGGLVVFVVPGLVYLAWYVLADRSRHVTVRVGTPPSVGGRHRLWPDDPGSDPRPPTPPPDVEPTVFGRHGGEPPAYPADPHRFPAVESPPPPPPPPTA
jgi:hypothetical protein